MPKVTKQRAGLPPTSPHSRPSNGQSVLDRIEGMDTGVQGVKMCLYGRGKTGKTRLACTFPKPLLLVGTEDGRKSVSGVKGCKYVRIYSSEDLDLLTQALRDERIIFPKGPSDGGQGDKPYRTVVLDTGGGLQDIITKEVAGLDEIPVQKNWGMLDQRGWGIVGAQTKERFQRLLDLADQQGKDILIVAHERNFKEDTDSPGSEMIMPTIGAALMPKTASWLNGACDYVCNAYLRSQKVKKKVKVAGQEQVKEFATGKNEYCLRIDTHPVYYTGFRCPEGTILPESIVNPHYDKLATLILGKE